MTLLVAHDWARDGWTPFTPVVMTQHGAQTFVTSVSNGRGVVTGTGAGNGSHRVAYLRNSTGWADSEIRSLIHVPTADWDGTNAQQGHLHRVGEIGSGVWEGIAVWTSIVFGGDYSFLHCAPVRFDGATLGQGGGPATFGAADSSYIERRLVVTHANRIDAFDVAQYRHVSPSHLYGLADGDLVTITGMAESSLNATAQAVSGVNRNKGFFQITGVAGADATDSFAEGSVVHADGVDKQKRWCPFVLATRVVGGTASSVTVEGKRWRIEDPEPDWGDPRVQTGAVTPSAEVPAVAVGPGACGLWAAHMHDGSAVSWGAATFRRL